MNNNIFNCLALFLRIFPNNLMDEHNSDILARKYNRFGVVNGSYTSQYEDNDTNFINHLSINYSNLDKINSSRIQTIYSDHIHIINVPELTLKISKCCLSKIQLNNATLCELSLSEYTKLNPGKKYSENEIYVKLVPFYFIINKNDFNGTLYSTSTPCKMTDISPNTKFRHFTPLFITPNNKVYSSLKMARRNDFILIKILQNIFHIVYGYMIFKGLFNGQNDSDIQRLRNDINNDTMFKSDAYTDKIDLFVLKLFEKGKYMEGVIYKLVFYHSQYMFSGSFQYQIHTSLGNISQFPTENKESPNKDQVPSDAEDIANKISNSPVDMSKSIGKVKQNRIKVSSTYVEDRKSSLLSTIDKIVNRNSAVKFINIQIFISMLVINTYYNHYMENSLQKLIELCHSYTLNTI